MKASITVPGRPRPQGSLRTLIPLRGSKPVTLPSDQGIYRYRADIQNAWNRAYENATPMSGACLMNVTFTFRRPDSHFMPAAPTKKREARTVLKKTAPVHYVSTPDVDKLLRAVGDALTGHAYVDDAQVTGGGFDKKWGDADMTHIQVMSLDD